MSKIKENFCRKHIISFQIFKILPGYRVFNFVTFQGEKCIVSASAADTRCYRKRLEGTDPSVILVIGTLIKHWLIIYRKTYDYNLEWVENHLSYKSRPLQFGSFSLRMVRQLNISMSSPRSLLCLTMLCKMPQFFPQESNLVRLINCFKLNVYMN